MLTYIWAEDENHGIGLNNSLPWRLPGDLAHFKNKTMGHPILMGRKTFDSLPKVLPGRHHLVLTHDHDFKKRYAGNDQVTVFLSLDKLNQYIADHQNEDIKVIGGRAIFDLFSDRVDILEVTKIHHVFKANIFMPQLDYEKFMLVKQVANYADSSNQWNYDFLTYQRK